MDSLISELYKILGKIIIGYETLNPIEKEIGKKLLSDFKGWRLGIVLPKRECQSYLELRLELKPIFHGGLEIFVGIGRI